MTARDNLRFLYRFIRYPGQVGAIAPSSPFLAEEMVAWIEWDRVQAAAEFGPGTGAFTDSIKQRLRPDAKFFAIERSPEFADVMRSRHPDVRLFEDSVENVATHCQEMQIEQLDAVVCGLPWASFPESLQRRCLDALHGSLRADGQFVTFAYWQGMLLPAAHRFASLLSDYFEPITRSRTVWRNMPPAFVYRCRRKPAHDGSS